MIKNIHYELVQSELNKLSKKDPIEFKQLKRLIYVLRKRGSELVRPQAAPVRKGIYELRSKNYRLLYKIVDNNELLLLHLLKKSGSKVSTYDFNIAFNRLEQYTHNNK